MLETAKKLLSEKKYKEAGLLLDKLLKQNDEDDSLWYFKGLLLLRLGEYEVANEAFDRALWIKKKPEYFRMKGIANLEIFEINEAKENFENALGMDAKDVLSNFFIAVCYMFLDDQASKGYIKKAYSLDRKKTKELIKNFYEAFFSRNKYVSKKTKEQLEKKMETIGSS